MQRAFFFSVAAQPNASSPQDLIMLLQLVVLATAASSSCMPEDVCYAGPGHYKEVENVTSAEKCCELCAAENAGQLQCFSWTYNGNKDNGACFFRPGKGTGETNSTKARPCISGQMATTPTPPPSPAPPAPAGALNVLMFAMDDLRPIGKAFGEPEALMPNLDALAENSTIFTQAYAQVLSFPMSMPATHHLYPQAATCGVSRASLLTSRRPDTTEVLSNGACPFAKAGHADWVSLPSHFRNHGYKTAGFGKIYHPNVCDGALVGEETKVRSTT